MVTAVSDSIESYTCVESIAKRESCSIRKVNMTISLAFLAPDLIWPLGRMLWFVQPRLPQRWHLDTTGDP